MIERYMLGERAQRHVSKGNDHHRGRMRDMSSTLHQSDIPYSKGERLFRGSSNASRQREQPQGENYHFPLISKGER
jgi:hypothetical protein